MIRIGVVGAGKIVPEFLQAAALVPELEITAIYARRAEARQPIAQQYHIARQYGDYEEMLKNPEIDAVYVALLNQLHAPFAALAMMHGKHVILEKPFTVTLEQTDALIELAKRMNVYLFEAITNQYNPNFLEMKKQLPRVGNVRIVQMNFSQYSSRYDQFLAGEILPVFSPECAGGSLTDLGIYNIHLAASLFGQPEQVHYYPNIVRGVDTSGILVLEYSTFRCVCVSAKDCKAPACVTIQGDKGCLISDSKPSILDRFSLQLNNGEQEDFALTDGRPRLSYELAAFADHFEKKDSAFFAERLTHTRNAMQILDAAIKDGGMDFSKALE